MLLCECESWQCREQIAASYDMVMWLRGAHPASALVVPGHENADDVVVGTDSLQQFVLVVHKSELEGWT